jgi:hypothetical protein
MGKKSSPAAPEPIDASKSMGEYLFGKDFGSFQGITDPELQKRLIGAEAQFRPQYTALELADINVMARGLEAGTKANPAYAQAQQDIASLEAKLASTPQQITQRETYRSGRSTRTRSKSVKNPEYARIEAELNAQRSRFKNLEPTTTTSAQPGLFDLLEEQSQRAGELQRSELKKQRSEDVAALQEFSPQVVEAYRAADPYSTGLADLQSQQAQDIIGAGASEAEQLLGKRGLELASSTGQLTPLEQRNVQQQARLAAQSRGREMGSLGQYGEMQSRMAEELAKREREIQMGSALLGQQAGLQQQRFGQGQQALQSAYGMQRGISGDLGATILGRPSQSIGLGGQMLGQAQQGAAGQMGPQLFDPNMGVNIAMQNQSNQTNYAGAMAQAGAARSAGTMGMLGTLGGAAIGLCWVAREVYGESNENWLKFRGWLLSDAPAWFVKLYARHGERFAKFISNKPLLKSAIRSWMNSKI